MLFRRQNIFLLKNFFLLASSRAPQCDGKALFEPIFSKLSQSSATYPEYELF